MVFFMPQNLSPFCLALPNVVVPLYLVTLHSSLHLHPSDQDQEPEPDAAAAAHAPPHAGLRATRGQAVQRTLNPGLETPALEDPGLHVPACIPWPWKPWPGNPRRGCQATLASADSDFIHGPSISNLSSACEQASTCITPYDTWMEQRCDAPALCL